MSKKWRNVRANKINVKLEKLNYKVSEPFKIIFEKNFDENVVIYLKEDGDLKYDKNLVKLEKENSVTLSIIPKIAGVYDFIIERVELDEALSDSNVIFVFEDKISVIDNEKPLKLFQFNAKWGN